ncbi:MAG TPA: DUF4190 domain-containing protein [Gaiellaceae bacterium]|jgi:hypothetical protein|nr:DUF4190 domain-containing protein [Gaiellaceae bacterium]
MTEPAAPTTTTTTPTRTSGKAIASLVLGIICLFAFGLILGILAIVFGVQARRETEADTSVGGRGLATAGITLGIIGIVLWAFILLLVL